MTVLVPAWPGRQPGIVLGVGAFATVAAGGLAVLRHRVSWLVRYVLVLLGSALIGLLLYAGSGGPATASYAGFYVFVAVYAFLFFGPVGATVQVLVAVATQAAALVAVDAFVAAQLVLSAGTIMASGAVVGVLAARVRDQAHTDELTGLPNRRAMDGVLQERLRRAGPGVALLAVDLDGFKALNDQYGHAAGDRLLQRVAVLWRQELRDGDVLGRVGGDEFIVLLEACSDDRAREVAHRLVRSIPRPVSACIGAVVIPVVPVPDLEEVLERVDRALYAGKARGRSSVVFSPGPGIPQQREGREPARA
jgi:diguanylate cyclase (GGDEF)-like protein